MANNNSGIHVGSYRVKPLGIVLFLLLILLIVGAVAVFGFGFNPLGDGSLFALGPTPTPEPTATLIPTPTPVPATPTPIPTPTPVPLPRSATIRVLGEITMDTTLLSSEYRQTETGADLDMATSFSLIKDLLGNADYTIGDVEGVLSAQQISSEPSCMMSPVSLLTILDDCGVDMLMLGNDHALDAGSDALYQEIAYVSSAGMDYLGVNRTPEEKSFPKVVDIGGFRVGFVAYCDELNVDSKKLSKADLAYSVNLVTENNAKEDIQALRNAGADVIIAVMNVGTQYEREANERQQKFAQYMAEAGVDVFIGYGPSVLQAPAWVETIDKSHKMLCLYSAGNLLSSNRDELYNACGAIYQFTLYEETYGNIQILDAEYIPTFVLETESETGQKLYRTLAVGQWTDDDSGLVSGMDYQDKQTLGQIWTELQKIMGDAISIARE